MQIDLPQDEQKKLGVLAAEAGFDSVEHYVTEHLRTLAQHPSTTQFAPLTQEELQESLAMCDRGMEEAAAGKGMSVDDARRHTLERLHHGTE
jgi:hypothetical protein